MSIASVFLLGFFLGFLGCGGAVCLLAWFTREPDEDDDEDEDDDLFDLGGEGKCGRRVNGSKP